MELLFDDDLVEAVVFLVAAGRGSEVPAAQVRRFHAEREHCYTRPDPDERAVAFARVNLGWFSEWGLDKLLGSTARELCRACRPQESRPGGRGRRALRGRRGPAPRLFPREKPGSRG